MERSDSHGKGTIVLATVKATSTTSARTVDIILSNNGYTVELKTKQPISSILAAAEEHRRTRWGCPGCWSSRRWS